MKKTLSIVTILISATIVSSCMSNLTHKQENTANKIASPAFLHQRVIYTNPFNLTIYERVNKKKSTINIYIEGDGFAWVSRRQKSLDPTPKTPLALKLAANDGADNVVYIARPCQYTKWQNEGACPNKYWTSHKYSSIIISSINEAIDQIKTRYNATGFNLIGYSGGGAIAALISADRDDILSLRTVAGNLDIDAHTKIHKVTQLYGSLNPIDIAPKLATLPQRHFVGMKDKNITPAIYRSYSKAIGNTNCLNYSLVANASHNKGWAERWSALLKEPVECLTAK